MFIARHLAAAALAVLPLTKAYAHPHIFIDAGLELIFDDQTKLSAVRVTWAYDEFYSLLILEDKGLDPDGDGVLTDTEQKSIQGFDMNWTPGFAGDLYALQNDMPLPLSGPLDFTATLKDGRLISTHLRRFDPAIAMTDAPLRLQIYDPEYYTAYTVASDPVLQGHTGCRARIVVPDPTEASKAFEAALATLGTDQTLDDLAVDNFPAIGATFAEEVQLTCAP